MRDFRIKYLNFLSILIFLTGIILALWFAWQYFGEKITSFSLNKKQPVVETSCNYQRKLDGVCVENQNQVNPDILGIMIENHVDSRPQAGIADARVVYEIPAEGKITRFLALFLADQKVDKIGPVRSARAYYLDYLSEYGDPLYMHVGGSPEALDLIKSQKVNDLNQFFNGQFYWRSTDRSAPHNVYTSSDLWNKALLQNAEKNKDFTAWKFSTSSPVLTGELKNKFSIDFGLAGYNVDWQLNTSTQKLERWEGGKPHLDELNQVITADNVVAMEMPMQVVDSEGRLQLGTVGSGEALVYQNGQVIFANWKKSSSNSRTYFYNDNGSEIVFNPGKIWIEVVPDIGEVSY